MKIIAICFFLLAFNSMNFAQECAPNQVYNEYYEYAKKDTLWRVGLQRRIDYYEKLTTDILPKHSFLRAKILDEIDKEDYQKIQRLKKIYDSQLTLFKTEINNTHQYKFDNRMPLSKLDMLLVFETWSVFPDSYAVIYNYRYNTNDKEIAIHIKSELYLKYGERLDFSCANNLFEDIRKLKKEVGIVDFNQNTGVKSEMDFKESNFLDLLLWSFS